jgi:hypothetical protein
MPAAGCSFRAAAARLADYAAIFAAIFFIAGQVTDTICRHSQFSFQPFSFHFAFH